MKWIPHFVRIYTLRGFESVLAGSVQVSTGTKTSLSFQDGPGFTRVHRRDRRGELPASHPRSYHLLADSGNANSLKKRMPLLLRIRVLGPSRLRG